jgi:hypothetical protein
MPSARTRVLARQLLAGKLFHHPCSKRCTMTAVDGVELSTKLGALPRRSMPLVSGKVRNMRLLANMPYYLPFLRAAVPDGLPISLGKVSVCLAGRSPLFSALPILPSAAAATFNRHSVTRLRDS